MRPAWWAPATSQSSPATPSAAGAKLVLVGDDAQLPEIAAGGSFRALAQSLGALELADNRRQEHGWEREALLAIRAGPGAEAVAAYADHGRVHVAAGPQRGPSGPGRRLAGRSPGRR